MRVHEYQAKKILKGFGIPVLESRLAETVAEAQDAARALGSPVVVKAQIHAGGRGKGGGVKLARTSAEAQEAAKSILGMQLVTPQTGPSGQKVRKVLIERGCKIEREMYVGLTLDRERGRLMLMASTEGGVEIEEVAARDPSKILKAEVHPFLGLRSYQAWAMAKALALPPRTARRFVGFATALSKAYVETDATLVEINPLVLTQDGELVALDAKMTFDDNALFRQRTIGELRDPTEEDPREVQAAEYDFSYIGLDGDIGCMVNGAGLAMATMDIIKLHGGAPANFLDVGGGATKEAVIGAFKILLGDEAVRAVLVNIFGGIMKCDVIAEGVVAAAAEVGLSVPLVCRLEGTNVDAARRILASSPLTIISADGMADAAAKVVAAAGENACAERGRRESV